MPFVDLGGRRLHLRTAGTGDVTVVFESGMGMSGAYWGLVAPAIAEHARTIVYDRAGLGSSAFDRAPRTLDRLADDLNALLSGPTVLVGHSWGGPISRLVASRSALVRGLVLIDPSDERDDAMFAPALARSMAQAGPRILVMALTGRYRRLAAPMGKALPPDLYAQFRAENFGMRAARAFHAEIRHFLPGLAALRAAPPDLGDLPVTIISNGAEPGTGDGQRAAHAASAAALPNGRHVIAEGAGHNIMLDRPDLVIQEILHALSRPAAGGLGGLGGLGGEAAGGLGGLGGEVAGGLGGEAAGGLGGEVAGG